MSNINPDYNWPTLNRKDLMSLSTINKTDAKFRQFKKIDTNRDWSTNLCSFDIEKSSPKPLYRFTQKPDYTNKIDDIDKCSSRVWHFEINKPEYNLSNKDIKGSSPKHEKFSTSRIPHNPLEPKYKLPTYEMLPYDQPKFIRDTLNTKDIIGSSPKKCNLWQTRKNENNFSIKKSPIIKDKMSNYNYMDYTDIAKNKFKSGRNVNPLDPVYDVMFENEPIGQIEKSKPNPLYKLVYSDPSNLKTTDISGAQIGTKNKINKYTNSETNNLIVADIPGTAVGSLKNHIVTNRHVNPVCPEYDMPGHSSLGEQFNPFGEKPKTHSNNLNKIDKINNNDDNDNNNAGSYVNQKEIMEEINQVSKAYLMQRKAEKRPLSQAGYTYSRSIIKSNENESGSGNKNENNKNNLKDASDNKSKYVNENNCNKADFKDNQENKIYKKSDSNKNIHFEGKENLKENEVIGFNNQIYSMPKLHFDPEMFKKPTQMFEHVHDSELQPRIIGKKSTNNKNNDKKSRLSSVKKTERTKFTEPNILPSSKIQSIHNNQIVVAKTENNKMNKSNNFVRNIQSAASMRSTMTKTFAEKLDHLITTTKKH